MIRSSNWQAMSVLTIRMLVISSLFLFCRSAYSQIELPEINWGTSYQYSLGTGVNSNLDEDDASERVVAEFGVQSNVAASDSVVSHTGAKRTHPLPEVVYYRTTFTSSVFVKQKDGDLGLDLVTTGTHWQDTEIYPYSYLSAEDAAGINRGRAEMVRFDSVSLFYRGEGSVPVLPSEDLRFNYRLAGTLTPSGVKGAVDIDVAVFDTPYTLDEDTPIYSHFANSPTRIDPFISVGAELDSNLKTKWNIGMGISVDTAIGTSQARTGRTLAFESVTFADGSTPESHGFEIVFASGITSPNIRTSKEVAAGDFTITSVLGGGGVRGGTTVAFEEVSTDGTLSSDYQTLASGIDLRAALGDEAFNAINFKLGDDSPQLWLLDFTGTPEGLMAVTFGYDESVLTVPEQSLAIWHFADGNWTRPAGQLIDIFKNTITVEVSSFSPFLLATVPEPSSGILLVGLALTFLTVVRGRK